MNDKSDFLPPACSTVNKKKVKKKLRDCSKFEEENSLFSINSDQLRLSLSDVTDQLEKQKLLARNSLHRANKVAGLPSKYLRANFSQSESQIGILSESTVSDSDLLQTPKNTSTPRSSTHSNSLLRDSLAHLSNKFTDTNVSFENLIGDFQEVIRHSDINRSTFFKPAASLLRADEISWRKRHEMPTQVEQFPEVNDVQESLSAFFEQRCNTLSDFPTGESPNVTQEPVPLIEASLLSDDRNLEPNTLSADRIFEQDKKSLSISMIQKLLASEDTPKRTENKLLKLGTSEEFQLPNKGPRASLPVSKNSSYTSDHSDNEAMKLICNKENINSLNTKDAYVSEPSSRTSSRSSSTLTSLQNDKLPIDTTKRELIWGCVKVGKCMTQEFVIRNKSTKRLGLQLTVSSQEFKIRKHNRNDSEPLSSNKILLHPYESKVIIVSFTPTKIGAAVDELYFTPLDSNLKQVKRQCVKLFGYGGLFKVDFMNLTRDTTGKFWLPLGKLDDRTLINSKFFVKNKGDLPVFIHISVHSLENSKVDVCPNFFVLIAQEEKEVLVTYKPSNEDYNSIQKSFHNTMVLDLGNLNVIFGTEADRARLRKICEKSVAMGIKIDHTPNILIQKIDGEVIPADVEKFKESPDNMKDIMKWLNQHQIVLTLERDPEQTIIQQFSDDSSLYQSLCQETTIICKTGGIMTSCYVAPAVIALTLPYKYKDTFFLKSDNDKKLNFKVNCQQTGFDVKPRSGLVDPNGTVIFTVKYSSSAVITEKKLFKVLVLVENEIFEVEVTVESLGSAKNKNKLLNCIV